MVLLLISLAADVTWMIFSPQSGNATAPAISKQSRPAPGVTVARFRDVAGLHLLGRADRPVGAAPVRQENLPETSLRLTLLGVFASDIPTQSYAIIADARKKEDYYQPGDQVEVNNRARAMLVSIHADHVVLERNGRQEKLVLPSDPLKSAPASTLPTRQRPSGQKARVSSAAGTKKRSIRDVWDDFHKNPQEFWKQTRVEPVMGKDNAIQGYKLSHKDKALMSGLGIRSSDVITSINGMPLNDPSSFAQLQSLLSELQPFTVTLIRNGKEQTKDIQP